MLRENDVLRLWSSDYGIKRFKLTVIGGAAAKVIDPIIQGLAQKFRLNKKICRKCYAHLDVKATVCRKRACGHWADLRMKKALKDEGGK